MQQLNKERILILPPNLAELLRSEDIHKNVVEKQKWSGHNSSHNKFLVICTLNQIHLNIFLKSPFSLEPLH